MLIGKSWYARNQESSLTQVTLCPKLYALSARAASSVLALPEVGDWFVIDEF